MFPKAGRPTAAAAAFHRLHRRGARDPCRRRRRYRRSGRSGRRRARRRRARLGRRRRSSRVRPSGAAVPRSSHRVSREHGRILLRAPGPARAPARSNAAPSVAASSSGGGGGVDTRGGDASLRQEEARRRTELPRVHLGAHRSELGRPRATRRPARRSDDLQKIAARGVAHSRSKTAARARPRRSRRRSAALTALELPLRAPSRNGRGRRAGPARRPPSQASAVPEVVTSTTHGPPPPASRIAFKASSARRARARAAVARASSPPCNLSSSTTAKRDTSVNQRHYKFWPRRDVIEINAARSTRPWRGARPRRRPVCRARRVQP